MWWSYLSTTHTSQSNTNWANETQTHTHTTHSTAAVLATRFIDVWSSRSKNWGQRCGCFLFFYWYLFHHKNPSIMCTNLQKPCSYLRWLAMLVNGRVELFLYRFNHSHLALHRQLIPIWERFVVRFQYTNTTALLVCRMHSMRAMNYGAGQFGFSLASDGRKE